MAPPTAPPVLHADPAAPDPAAVAAALREFRPVSTSRPSPARFLAVHEELAARGVTEVLAVHLSGEMSGTLESAQLAARDTRRHEAATVPRTLVDCNDLAHRKIAAQRLERQFQRRFDMPADRLLYQLDPSESW